MLSPHLVYFKPNTIQEATKLFQDLREKGKKPLYYGGGTEIITLARLNLVHTDAIIDLKVISECNIYQLLGDELIIGSTIGLYKFEEKILYPLLTEASKEIADHTARNKITVGGNICGEIYYREAVLPFLLADSEVVIAGPSGIRKKQINDVFQKELLLNEGEFLVQILTKKEMVNVPSISIKKRKQWDDGYPLVTVASLKKDGFIRFAFSGLCPFPFRSKEMEERLNDKSLSYQERISAAVEYIPSPILNDIEGSKEYRLFVLKNTLIHIFSTLGGEAFE